MSLINYMCKGLKRRFRIAGKRVGLELRRQFSGKTVWIDYGWMQLPYHGDGDLQELYYHLYGAEWWLKEWRLLAPYVKPDAVIVDVGANLGFLTTLFSKLTSGTGQVHSFEPSPVVFGKLREVVSMNALKNVRLHNMGCGEKKETLRLQFTESSGNSSLRLRRELVAYVRDVQDVEVVRLDDYLAPELTRLDLLKIDTEGFEDCVIAGTMKTLECFRPVIYLELTSEYLEPSRRALALLKSLGYYFPIEPMLEECHNGENFIALPPCRSRGNRVSLGD